ncbi:MAG: hypothetical protein COV67_13795 [Nitrospinae bacterium CG11_big_fil_rev_8_21_14_0_20_56_8]|nr:MAG: hypothetical protein COV67_13795 [Nitrospinae bacterium CG11_big_fil_rev_8_21_14_0_20_56_8]
MIPGRFVRYFIYLGRALGKGERTQFSLFKDSLSFFYFSYIRREYFLKNPLYYPRTYGVN